MLPESNGYKLLTILQSYAPIGSAQQKCTDLVHEMERDRFSDKEIVERLAGYIIDGLRYENWPWND